MSFIKKMKDRGNQKLDSLAKNPYLDQGEEIKKEKRPLWLAIAMPIVSIGAAFTLIISINFFSSINNSSSNLGIESDYGGGSSYYSNYLKEHALNNVNKTYNGPLFNNSSYSSSLNHFASDFYHLIDSKKVDDDENIIFSPISLSTCFSLLYEGASGESKNELENAFYFDSANEKNNVKNVIEYINRNQIGQYVTKKCISNLSNAFFVDDEFLDYIKQSYVDTLTNYYYANAYHGKLNSDSMHNALAEYINENTNNFFNLKGENFKDYAGVLWLVNTLYLKANWGFNDIYRNNQLTKFTSLKNEVNNNVEYLRAVLKNRQAIDNEDYYLFSLPLYGGFAFNILLPKLGTDYKQVLNDNIDTLLNADLYNNGITYDLYISFPEFKVTQKFDLKGDNYLSDLGIIDSINPDKADFTKIYDKEKMNNQNIYIDKVIHEAGIDVNIDGIEAAAYTVIEVPGTSAEPIEIQKLYIDVDHPFLYSITGGSSTSPITLFLGELSSIK